MVELVYYMPPSSESSPGRVASQVWKHLFALRDDMDLDLRLLSDDPGTAERYREVSIDPAGTSGHVGGAVFYFPISPVWGPKRAFRRLRRLHRSGARLVSDYHGDLREDLHYHRMNGDVTLMLYTLPSAMMASRVLNWHEMLVLHSRYLEGIVRGRYDLRARTAIVPNGLDRELLDRDHGRQELEGDLAIGYHGRLTHEKGLDILMEAMAMLPRGEGQDVHLHMLGKGPKERSLRRTARRLGLEGRVHFMGYRPMAEVYSTLASADLLAYPSRFDNFPVSVLEAMGVGSAPVLFSDHMGMGEFVGPALEGNEVPLSAEAFRDAISDVLEGRTDVATIVREQHATARRYTWDRVARDYVDLFNGMA
jgi:glycogen(starch) synthase